MKEESLFSAKELFSKGIGITYDDFTICDTHYTKIDKEDINLESEMGKGIILKTPIIAAPMDTVTNANLCIALALEGGIGCIHYNYKGIDGSISLDKQIDEIISVKRFENGFIEYPITVSPEHTIAQAIIIGINGIAGNKEIDTFPVTVDGKSHGELIGLLRKEDYSRVRHRDVKVGNRMLPLEKLIKAELPISLKEANELLLEKHIWYLPIVDKNGNLKYLVTRRDLDKNEEYPLATKDDKKRLRVLFAVETKPEQAYDRLERGFAAGADGCIIDTSQGFTKYEIDMIRYIRKKYGDKVIIGGNISTQTAHDRLNKEGLDAYRCGQGPGSICTTAGAIGISRAGASAVYHCANRKGDMKTIADGGLKQPGDIFKALAIGANAVMLGNMLAGTEESPGEIKIDPESGLPVKYYRGMGSEEANVGGIRGYARHPQGVSGHVKYKGSIHEWIPLIKDALLSAFQVVDCKDINQLHKNLYNSKTLFERRTEGSLRESGVHDLNYRR